MSESSTAPASRPEVASSEQQRRASRPTVVYVMGAGHSGSTILGVALGNCDGVFFAGEVVEWMFRSGAPKFGGHERTRFWASGAEDGENPRDLPGTDALLYPEPSSAGL